MSAFPIPPNEHERLSELDRHDLMGSAPEERFDGIVTLAARLLKVPISLISIVGAGEQWFKARHGLDVPCTPREQSFCTHAILATAPLVVPDATLDPRFATNALVVGPPFIRFYAGAPLVSAKGVGLGALCIIDRKPRYDIGVSQLAILTELAAVITTLFDRRRDERMAAEPLN